MSADGTRGGDVAICHLDAALDAVVSTALHCLAPEQLGARSVALECARNKLDAAISSTLAEADRAGTAQLSGTRTLSQYVAARTHCDPTLVRADIALGRWLVSFPVLESAFAAGAISRRHLHELKRVDSVRLHFAMIRDQHIFTEACRTLEWKSYKHSIGYWVNANDPDGNEPNDQLEKNHVTATTHADGTVSGTFRLDPVSGGVFRTQLEREEQRIYRNDNVESIVRTAGQRRAEALVSLAARAAGNTAGRTPQPLIHVVMSKEVAEETLKRLAEPSKEPLPISYDDVDGRCELIDGTPIHPKLALVLLATAKFRRHVMNSKSRTLDLGHDVRLFPKWMKEALLVEARGQCSTAGCDAPFTWLQADHRIPNSHGGPTSTVNGDGVCDPDNLYKADGAPLPERNAAAFTNYASPMETTRS